MTETLAPASWRALHIGGMVVVALLVTILAWQTRSTFAWVAAGTAILVALIAGYDLWQRELGERRA